MKKKNIKIKHRKYSLYQRKKSKGRKFLTGLLMVILVAGLCVLGYGLGKPLVEYFSNRGNEPPQGIRLDSTGIRRACGSLCGRNCGKDR